MFVLLLALTYIVSVTMLLNSCIIEGLYEIIKDFRESREIVPDYPVINNNRQDLHCLRMNRNNNFHHIEPASSLQWT